MSVPSISCIPRSCLSPFWQRSRGLKAKLLQGGHVDLKGHAKASAAEILQCALAVYQTAGTPRGCSALEHMHAREPLLPAELLCLGSLLLTCFNVSRGETLIPQLSMQLGRCIFAHNIDEIFFNFIFKNYFSWRLCL